MNANYRQEAFSVMQTIACDIRQELDRVGSYPTDVSGYVQQREVINRVFRRTTVSDYSLLGIIQRLTIIDSFYSTNARFSYYSIEQLAIRIYNVGSEQDVVAYFDSIARGGKDTCGLFSAHYGVRKNLSDGDLLMSLVSKYAYYVLLQNTAAYPLGFPIYDSLVVGIISKAQPRKYFGIDKGQIAPKNLQTPSIEDFVEAIDKVRVRLLGNITTLFGAFQQFDILDAYLWRMGKLDKGNYSLLLTCDNYNTFVRNLGLVNMDGEQLHVSFPTIKHKNGKTEFDNVVRYRCSTLSISSIVYGLSNTTLMSLLITHWKNHFKQSK